MPSTEADGGATPHYCAPCACYVPSIYTVASSGLDDVVAQLMQLSRQRQEWVYDDDKKERILPALTPHLYPAPLP